MDREVLVSLEQLNQVVKYLADRPYKEVVQLIAQLTQSIREVEPNGQTTTTTQPQPPSDGQ